MLDRIRVRAEGVGCHCWAFAGEQSPDEITVFIEGRFPDGALRPIFEGDIEALRSVTAGVERVRSLVEHPREEGT